MKCFPTCIIGILLMSAPGEASSTGIEDGWENVEDLDDKFVMVPTSYQHEQYLCGDTLEQGGPVLQKLKDLEPVPSLDPRAVLPEVDAVIVKREGDESLRFYHRDGSVPVSVNPKGSRRALTALLTAARGDSELTVGGDTGKYCSFVVEKDKKWVVPTNLAAWLRWDVYLLVSDTYRGADVHGVLAVLKELDPGHALEVMRAEIKDRRGFRRWCLCFPHKNRHGVSAFLQVIASCDAQKTVLTAARGDGGPPKHLGEGKGWSFIVGDREWIITNDLATLLKWNIITVGGSEWVFE